MPRKPPTLIGTDDLPPPPEMPGEFDPSDIDVVQPDRLDFKAREAKFMNEMVEIMIDPGDKPNDPLYVDIGHNGITQVVLRGQVQAVRRKFLYSALMARRITINNVFGIGRDGSDINRATPSAASAYRTSLVSDNNPQGGTRWVQRVMSEAHGLRAA